MSNHLPAGQPAIQGGGGAGGAGGVGGGAGGGGGGGYGGPYGYNNGNGIPGQPPGHHGHQHGRGRGGRNQQNPYYQHQQHAQNFQPNYNHMYGYVNQPYGNQYYNQAYQMPAYGQGMPFHGHGVYPYQQPYQPQPPPPQPSHYQQSPSMASLPPYALNQSPSIHHPASVSSPFSHNPAAMVGNAPAVVPPPMPPTPASNHSSQILPGPYAPPALPAPYPQSVETPLDQQHLNGDFAGDFAGAVEHDASVEQQLAPSRPESTTGNGTEVDLYPQIYGPVPTPNPASIKGALPWTSDSPEPWPKRKKKKKKTVPIEGEDVMFQASQAGQADASVAPTDADLPQPAAPTSKSSVAGDAPDHSSHTESTVNVATDTVTTSTPEPVAQKPVPQNPTAVPHHLQAPKAASPKAAPAAPVVPVLPKESPVVEGSKPEVDKTADSRASAGESQPQTPTPEERQEAKPAAPPARWADLLKGSGAAKSAARSQAAANGTAASSDVGSGPQTSGAAGLAQPNTRALAEVLRSYRVDRSGKVALIEPRGLYNSAVDCYINSILQVLLYCLPFCDFLEQVKTQSVFNIKNEQHPLLEALIGFRDQFRVIKSAATTDELKAKLKAEDYQQYGEPLRVNDVYDVAFSLPAFVQSKLKLGKQQDAEEFLTLLLDELQTECARVIEGTTQTVNDVPTSPVAPDEESGWTTVDSRQKSSVTQQSGLPQVTTPLTRIFHGQIRHELQVPGRKLSNTDQTLQTLRLHIDAPSIKDVMQALHHWNVPEPIKELSTPQKAATSQAFIHSLPHVLVLHLLRFEHLSGNAYRKDGKKVGYPLELTIPSTILSRQKRKEYSAGTTGIPRYSLVAVVYHHGADMDQGHYSVDVRRQDGHSWVRINDTKIEAITGEDVAETGEGAAARPAGGKEKDTEESSSNRFAAMGGEDSGNWEKVGSATNGKKHVNGKSSGTSTPRGAPAKDNKVAYLLFYQQIS